MVILLFSKKIRIIKNKLCISLCTDVPPPTEKKSEEGGTSVHRLVMYVLYDENIQSKNYTKNAWKANCVTKAFLVSSSATKQIITKKCKCTRAIWIIIQWNPLIPSQIWPY